MLSGRIFASSTGDSRLINKLRRSIKVVGGLTGPIVVSGKDGTVLEGNHRHTSYLVLHKELLDDERGQRQPEHPEAAAADV